MVAILAWGQTGYDCAKYLVEHNIKPKEYRVHSMNYAGAENIRQIMDKFLET